MEEEVTPDPIDAALLGAGEVLFCTQNLASTVEGLSL